jgi:hypothetical protein
MKILTIFELYKIVHLLHVPNPFKQTIKINSFTLGIVGKAALVDIKYIHWCM